MGNKGPQLDPKEVAKEQKRIITRSERKLNREINALERQEAKTMKEVKKLAVAGQHGAAKILSKDIARNRATRNHYRTMAS
jgi:charged multivesicular body protein 2A